VSAVALAKPGVAPRAYTLHPGDVVCAERGDKLETLLGSCVAIVMTDPRRTIGAMCHIVHSSDPLHGAASSAAYANVALDTMYRLLRRRGIVPALCHAYVYGGGNMFPELMPGPQVGENNARWAVGALQHDCVELLHVDVGGNCYRRLSWTVGPLPPVATAVPV
jgi:chemotaxis protein CheD